MNGQSNQKFTVFTEQEAVQALQIYNENVLKFEFTNLCNRRKLLLLNVIIYN